MTVSQGVFSCPDTALMMMGEDPARPKALQGAGAKGVRARSGGAQDQQGSRYTGCAYLGGACGPVAWVEASWATLEPWILSSLGGGPRSGLLRTLLGQWREAGRPSSCIGWV